MYITWCKIHVLYTFSHYDRELNDYRWLCLMDEESAAIGNRKCHMFCYEFENTLRFVQREISFYLDANTTVILFH